MIESKTLGSRLFDLLNGLFMLVIFVGMVYPFIYVINSSFSNMNEVYGSMLLLPKGFNVAAYKMLFENATMLRAFFVSAARSIIGPVLMLIVTGMASYVLAQPNLIFRKGLNTFCVLTMYVSAGIIPEYIFMKYYGLLDNFLVYILPNLTAAFNIILMRTYIEGIPRSLQEAAYVDGATDFQAYWKVIFPVCKPVNAAILLFGILQQWNNLMDTQMYCAMEKKLHTLQYVLYDTLNSMTSLEYAKNMLTTTNVQSVKMAMTVITVVPIMCVYPFLQKHFTSGIMLGSVKA